MTPNAEVLCIVLLSVLAIVIFICVQPFRQGFHSRDASIQYPLLPLTIGLKGVLLLAFAGPVFAIILTEKLMYYRTSAPLCKRFAFVTLINIVIMLFFKFTVGRLRPHFLAACRPDVDVSSGRYFSGSEYQCHPLSQRDEWQARQSFYSGHASLAICGAVFLVCYSYHHYPRSMFKSVCQVLLLLIGSYPGITQIQNHWHHTSDVLTGYVVGAVTAVIGYYAV